MPARRRRAKGLSSQAGASRSAVASLSAGIGQRGAGRSPLAANAEVRPLKWKPATLALLLQLSALPVTLVFWEPVAQYVGLAHDIYVLAVLQGSIAMLLSVICRADEWWRLIQFAFPPGLLVMYQLALPSWFYCFAFMLTASLFWNTFRTQVPFYPSSPDTWHRLLAELPQGRRIHLIDIGSGLGDLIMHLAAAMPGSRFTGIEIAPLPWLLSRWRARCRAVGNATFTLGNYEKLDFAQFDVVFAYLSPAAMAALWQKAAREMRPGSRLMSYEFEIPGIEADCIIRPEGKPPIHIWHF